MQRRERDAFFERMIEPLLDSGLNLALSLTANRADAEDSLQAASIKAYRGLDSFRGDDPKPWFLRIVRNEAMRMLRQRHRVRTYELTLDEEIANARSAGIGKPESDPAKMLITKEEGFSVRNAISGLSVNLRETIMLRELEGLSYQEIAEVTEVPIGTVMSRLARARNALLKALEADPS